MEAGGQTRPQESSRAVGPPPLPRPRPGWVVALGAIMLILAFPLFLEGLSGLRFDRPADLSPETAVLTSDEAAKLELRRRLAQAFSQVDGNLLRVYAASKLVLAVVMLFAVAAIAANDRRGRAAALAAGWVGIVYHLGSALFFLIVVRAGLLASVPAWIDQVVTMYGGPDPGRSREELLGSASTLVLLVPVTASLLGIGFNLILIRFFGGARGRAFYGGVAVEVPNQPHPRG
jgi:hypothetical protein